jgi:serine/threonine protein kinase
MLISVAEAVHFAHQNGIIHRDLKPANILISDGESESEIRDTPVVKITDFGLAKVLAGPNKRHSSTQKGTLLGTPAFMPPEQLGDGRQAPGPTNDVYALGAILFAMLTGRPPYDEGNFVMTVLRVRAAKEPPALLPLRPEVPKEFEEVCRKCLQKSPASRYQTAQALADDLRQVAAKRSWPAEREIARAWLEPADGSPAFEISRLSTLMGRAKECDIRLDNAAASRRHCRILRFGDKLFIEDVGSRGGIRLNGKSTAQTHLHDGDQLQIASAVFRVGCLYI